MGRVNLLIKLCLLASFLSLLSSCKTYQAAIIRADLQVGVPLFVIKDIKVSSILGLELSHEYARKIILQEAQKHLGLVFFSHSDDIPIINSSENSIPQLAYPLQEGQVGSADSSSVNPAKLEAVEGAGPKFYIEISLLEKDNILAGARVYNIIGFLELFQQVGQQAIFSTYYASNFPVSLSSPSVLAHMARKLFYVLAQKKKKVLEIFAANLELANEAS